MAFDLEYHLEKTKNDMLKGKSTWSSIYLGLSNQCLLHDSKTHAEMYFNLYKQCIALETQTMGAQNTAVNFYGKGLTGMLGAEQQIQNGTTILSLAAYGKVPHKDTDIAQKQDQAYMLDLMANEARIKRDIFRMEMSSEYKKTSCTEAKVVTEHVGRKFREGI